MLTMLRKPWSGRITGCSSIGYNASMFPVPSGSRCRFSKSEIFSVENVVPLSTASSPIWYSGKERAISGATLHACYAPMMPSSQIPRPFRWRTTARRSVSLCYSFSMGLYPC